MSDAIRVFVNADVVEVPAGASVSDAVRTVDPLLPARISAGAAYVTDGRGISIDLTDPLVSGAILRIVVRARARSADAES
jgi:hypothetical protein